MRPTPTQVWMLQVIEQTRRIPDVEGETWLRKGTRMRVFRALMRQGWIERTHESLGMYAVYRLTEAGRRALKGDR